ncbi:MAG TPA: anti-sigma factor [Blastocatellia bacterium]|nr:anti-sigma factor [Blastocatellia bacterium]
MRHDCPTHEIKEQAALYALGVLTHLEASAFESHIREGCEICRAELFKFERAAGMFALNAPQIKPPAYLIDLLQARIEKETAARTQSPENQFAVDQPFLTRALAHGRQIVAAIPWRLVSIRALPWAAASAFGVVSIMLLVALSSAHSASANQDHAIIEAKKQIEQMHGLVERATGRSKELAEIIAILGVPGVRQVQLVGEGPAASSRITLYMDDKSGLCIISADQLPVADGMVHHLWFVTPEGPKNAGTLQTDENGHAFLETSAEANFRNLNAACITLEPEGEVDHPTTRVLALGKITRSPRVHKQNSAATPDQPSDSEEAPPQHSQTDAPEGAEQRPRHAARQSGTTSIDNH